MLTTLLAGLLTAIRDFVIAAALAWVGVTMERVETHVDPERACASDSCQQQAE